MRSQRRLRPLEAIAPQLGIAVLTVLLTGCWLVDRYFDIPVRRHLGRIVPRMLTVRGKS
jgi:hypothetical protein